jgi:hypothetical protein
LTHYPDPDKPWDAVLLVLMGEKFVPAVIYDADHVVIATALLRRGSKARNVRALAITEFPAIGRQV